MADRRSPQIVHIIIYSHWPRGHVLPAPLELARGHARGDHAVKIRKIQCVRHNPTNLGVTRPRLWALTGTTRAGDDERPQPIRCPRSRQTAACVPSVSLQHEIRILTPICRLCCCPLPSQPFRLFESPIAMVRTCECDNLKVLVERVRNNNKMRCGEANAERSRAGGRTQREKYQSIGDARYYAVHDQM